MTPGYKPQYKPIIKTESLNGRIYPNIGQNWLELLLESGRPSIPITI